MSNEYFEQTKNLSCALCGYFCNNPHHHNNWFDTTKPTPQPSPTVEEEKEMISLVSDHRLMQRTLIALTGLGYHDSIKDLCKAASHPSPQPAGKDIDTLLKKYKTYVGNIQWHIEKNEVSNEEYHVCKQRISDFDEIVRDLNALSASQPVEAVEQTEQEKSFLRNALELFRKSGGNVEILVSGQAKSKQ